MPKQNRSTRGLCFLFQAAALAVIVVFAVNLFSTAAGDLYEAVLLVPKYIVRRKLSLDSQEFYTKQITDFVASPVRITVSKPCARDGIRRSRRRAGRLRPVVISPSLAISPRL